MTACSRTGREGGEGKAVRKEGDITHASGLLGNPGPFRLHGGCVPLVSWTCQEACPLGKLISITINRPVFPALGIKEKKGKALGCPTAWSMTQKSRVLVRKGGGLPVLHLGDQDGGSRELHPEVCRTAWLPGVDSTSAPRRRLQLSSLRAAGLTMRSYHCTMGGVSDPVASHAHPS